MNYDWVANSQSKLVCSDWGPNYSDIPAPAREALSDWELLLPGTQLNQGCGSGRSAVWLLRLSAQGAAAWPCGPAWAWACVEPLWMDDTTREGRYLYNTDIWINDLLVNNDSKLRYTVAHELGHVFGLDEWYANDCGETCIPQCNPSPPASVMDTYAATSACDAELSTYFDDNDTAHSIN